MVLWVDDRQGTRRPDYHPEQPAEIHPCHVYTAHHPAVGQTCAVISNKTKNSGIIRTRQEYQEAKAHMRLR